VSNQSVNPLAPDPDVEWAGEKRPYDLVREFVVVTAALGVLIIVLAAIFSSPDKKPVTIRSWATAAPTDFLSTAVAELDGTSDAAGYGPPYTHTPGVSQKLGPINLTSIGGVRIPIDTAQDYVLGPLSAQAGSDVRLAAALARYGSAPASQQSRWATAYTNALAHVHYVAHQPVTPSGNYGPVAVMMRALLAQARSGGLDGALLTSSQFYQTDFTKPLLFLADGAYMANLAQKEHLLGDQWGMMNETGRYPGQTWLWLYTTWYQIPPFSTSPNADVQVWALMMVLTAALALLPFIPGLRSIPRWIPVYRLIWRSYYRRIERA
jgi:hypothetical protein